MIFLAALGVRLLYWQDGKVEVLHGGTIATSLVDDYRYEARRITEQGGLLVPREPFDTGDARMVFHPPGYLFFLIALYGERAPDPAYTRLRIAQAIIDSLSAVMVLLIAAELLPLAAAVIGALFVSLSPHLAYYSQWLSPDSFAVLPILLAVYLVIRAGKRPRLATVAAAGAMIGFSCWLRVNALLLAPFLAIAILLLFERGKRWRYSAIFVFATALIIAPLTIRNWVTYNRFIPVSLGAGITLIEGIAEYDKEGRFNLPPDDAYAGRMEAQQYGRPEYARSLWFPDGVQRDRDRFARGVAVIRSDPGWFLGVMLHRTTFMLRYNDFGPQISEINSTRAPTVSSGPNFGHRVEAIDEMTPVWSNSSDDLIRDGTVLSSQAKAWVANDHSMQIAIEGSLKEDIFASAPIATQKYTDYVMTLEVLPCDCRCSIKVKGVDPRITLAQVAIPKVARKKRAKKAAPRIDNIDPTGEQAMTVIRIPFATSDKDEVRLVVSNEANSPAVINSGRAEVFQVGPTPHLWTNYPRSLVRGLQKNLFKTNRMLALIVIGIMLLALARRRSELLILLVVPVYYLLAQSFFHTEYRYILAIHYFLFVVAAATMYVAGKAMLQVARLARARYSRQES